MNIEKLIMRFPKVRKLKKENVMLKKRNKLLFEMYQIICEKNEALENTLEDALKEKLCLNTVDETVNEISNDEEIPFLFQKRKVDDVATLAERIVSASPYGMAAADFPEKEKVKYRKLADEDIQKIIEKYYMDENTSK